MPKYLTAEEVAIILCRSRKAIYILAARKKIPGAVKICGRLLFDEAILLEWLRQQPASSVEEATR